MNASFLQRTFLLVSLLIACSVLHAQDIDSIKTWSEEQFAQRMTDQMTTEVPLRKDQVDLVHKINVKFAHAVLPVVKSNGDQQAVIDVAKKNDRIRSEELEMFLDTDQMRKVRLIQQENRKKLKQRAYAKTL